MTDKEHRTYYVYKHTLPDGRCYIGATYRGIDRWGKNGNGYRLDKVFYPLIKQFGWNNIIHEILYSNLTQKEAREKEKALIIEAQEKGIAINKQRGGYDILNKELLVQIAGLRKFGLSFREIGELYQIETSTASFALYNKTYLKYYSEEEFFDKVTSFVEQNRGKYHREDGKTFNTNGVPSRIIIQKNKSGIIVGEYESITAAAQANGVLHTSIVNNLKGRSKYCGGYKYEYK
jgi:hypothetical protein